MVSIEKTVNTAFKPLVTPKKFNFDFGELSKVAARLNTLDADKFEKTSGDAIFSQATFKKAKDMVVETILGNEPKESLVFVKDDKIMHHVIGETHKIEVDDVSRALLDDANNKIAVIHSHPIVMIDGSAHPVSYSDFSVINDRPGARSIYAINSLGEYSMLQKQGNARPSVLKVIEYEEKYEQELVEALTGEDKEFMKKCLFGPQEGVELTQEEKEQLEKEFEEFRNKESVVQATRKCLHNFWLKYASELGLRYETNYSCFN